MKMKAVDVPAAAMTVRLFLVTGAPTPPQIPVRRRVGRRKLFLSQRVFDSVGSTLNCSLIYCADGSLKIVLTFHVTVAPDLIATEVKIQAESRDGVALSIGADPSPTAVAKAFLSGPRGAASYYAIYPIKPAGAARPSRVIIEIRAHRFEVDFARATTEAPEPV